MIDFLLGWFITSIVSSLAIAPLFKGAYGKEFPMLITNPHPGHVNGIAWRWDNRSVSLDMYRGDYGHMMIQVFVLDASTNQHLLTEQINMDHNPELFDLYKFEESRWNDLEVYLFVQSILECDD